LQKRGLFSDIKSFADSCFDGESGGIESEEDVVSHDAFPSGFREKNFSLCYGRG
jgi:hypothetical protein